MCGDERVCGRERLSGRPSAAIRGIAGRRTGEGRGEDRRGRSSQRRNWEGGQHRGSETRGMGSGQRSGGKSRWSRHRILIWNQAKEGWPNPASSGLTGADEPALGLGFARTPPTHVPPMPEVAKEDEGSQEGGSLLAPNQVRWKGGVSRRRAMRR